ncbi:major capsid protein [Acinetobacter ursingii]|uniref:major capsid protein n=1 Tax=Acinetobacter ursingii TaxID=108980 RepID=UPI0024472D0A|nr:major capsid protein [Acinetobacter ursingii]MDH2021081.1 major capsid protein [Acinetobacter ursingii]MDH2073453.1 major capsid protein [Acinetobacter ursingii]
MDKQSQLTVVERNVPTKLTRFGLFGTGVTALAMSNANAALQLDPAAFITDIGTAETFGIAIGLAILGFVAVMALVKKSRGAVK